MKFRNFLWFWNFKILFASRVMSYESFFEKSRYDANMTHNIYNIHIIWLQILFLIQWCKNFWDLPTQNFQMNFSQKCVGGIKISTSDSNSALNSASDSMRWYGVYIDIIDDSLEDPDCVGVKRYIPWKPTQTVYKPYIIAYCPTQNLTLNPNLKLKIENDRFQPPESDT